MKEVYLIIIFFVKRTVICLLAKIDFIQFSLNFLPTQEYIILLIPNHVMLVTLLVVNLLLPYLRSKLQALGQKNFLYDLGIMSNLTSHFML